jgi:hypothetical protein
MDDTTESTDPNHELRRFFAALADEDRLRIAGVLALREASTQELAALLSMPDRDASRHLAMLADLGIVAARREGAIQVWSLDVQGLREQRKRLLARERVPSPADRPGTPEWERLVLRNYFDGERLKEIPSNQKKKQVILTWLVSQFEVGREYTEREVNEIIKRHHPDFAELRRALVDYHYMQRENGVYWRVDDAASAAAVEGAVGAPTLHDPR